MFSGKAKKDAPKQIKDLLALCEKNLWGYNIEMNHAEAHRITVEIKDIRGCSYEILTRDFDLTRAAEKMLNELKRI